MKKQLKFFNLLLVFSLFSTLGRAQLPDGSIAPDFTVTDHDGNTYTLYELLDSGYTVIMDLSAVWCGPCWSYHQSGALDELWANHGPIGAPGVNASTSDDVFVLWVEGDPNTPESAIHGGGNSQGDWTDGVHFPLINDDNIASAYSVSYWPTIYTICPNRTLTETGALGATQHYQKVQQCPQPVQGVNASLLTIESTVVANGCGNTASGDVNVTIQNSGSDTLGQISLALVVNGDTMEIENFDGSQLGFFATQEVSFDNINLSADSFLIVIATLDANLDDNVEVVNVSLFDGNTEEFVKVNLMTDNFAREIYLEIKAEGGSIVWSEGNESIAGNYDTNNQNPPTDPTSPLENNTEYSWEVNLPSIGCYTFLIGDYFGDGLNASQYGGTDGWWTIQNNTGTTISEIQNIDFEGSDNSAFNNNAPGDTTIVVDEFTLSSLSLYPNPVNNTGEIRFELIQSSNVRLEVVDMLGKVILTKNEKYNAGWQMLKFNVAHLQDGVYFAKTSINDEVNVIKFTVLK